MRGKTWQFSVMQTATTLAAAHPKTAPATIAQRAADIADAVYVERMTRNAADMAAAELEPGEGLNTADECMGEG